MMKMIDREDAKGAKLKGFEQEHTEEAEEERLTSDD